MGYHLTIKGKKTVTHAIVWADPENAIPSVLTKSHILYDSPYLSCLVRHRKTGEWLGQGSGLRSCLVGSFSFVWGWFKKLSAQHLCMFYIVVLHT